MRYVHINFDKDTLVALDELVEAANSTSKKKVPRTEVVRRAIITVRDVPKLVEFAREATAVLVALTSEWAANITPEQKQKLAKLLAKAPAGIR